MKKMNSNDIAKLAGVSRSTVSRVINRYANVPEETREKVMKVIKENHYYPQFSGQLLTGKKTKTIGFFWVTYGGNIARDTLSSNFFANVIDAAAREGYLVLSCIVKDLSDKSNVNYVRKIFMQERIDAGIFIGINNNEPLISELISLGKIVGLFDYFHENESYPNCITVNFEQNTGEKVIDYVHALGHRKIGIIDGDMARYSSVQRHESFFRGMMKHNIPINNKWLCYGGLSTESGYAAAMNMFTACGDDLPTVLCAHNDAVAFGVYQACNTLGLRIPKDISVIGIDGHMNAASATPPLSTVQFDFQEMFSSLVKRLIQAIQTPDEVQENEYIPGTLVARQSCLQLEGSD